MSVGKQRRDRFIWFALLALISVLYVCALQRKFNHGIDSIVVKIKPIKGDKNLVEPKEIQTKVKSIVGYNIEDATIEEIPIKKIENQLSKDKRIRQVEVFIDSKNKLNVIVLQRQPVVRVMDNSHSGYYLDEEGKQIPTAVFAAVRVPIATGYIDLYEEGFLKNSKPSRLKDVFLVAKDIQNDPFLYALIEQIDVTETKEILLIPKIGRQKIIFGDASQKEEKFYRLKTMYQKGMISEGWRKFDALDIRWKNQVVGIGHLDEKLAPLTSNDTKPKAATPPTQGSH